jgi:hypothetical protein
MRTYKQPRYSVPRVLSDATKAKMSASAKRRWRRERKAERLARASLRAALDGIAKD